MSRAVFLDRDGVINQSPPEGDYITAWEDFHILPGVAEAIALLKKAGFSVIVVTNQRCVARGLMTDTDLEEMHRRMTEVLARAGALVDDTYYCPHEAEPPCECRKPAPGMLLKAARSHGIELQASWMIGDSETDVEAGKNAGCKTARIFAANEESDELRHSRTTAGCAEIVATSLPEAVRRILEWEKSSSGRFTADVTVT